MAKIDNEGLEKLQHIRNAVNAMYDKLDTTGTFESIAEEFQYIVEILDEAKHDWERI